MPREKVEIYLYFFFGFGARWDCVDNTTSRPLYPWETYLVPILQETGWAQGQVCKFAESLFPTGIWSPDRLARNDMSLICNA